MKRPLVPRLRFPEFREAEEWQSPSLGEISEPVEERVGDQQLTPVSISAGIGFVPQYQKFGRDISGNQYQLYTVVRDGNFVYNKGNSLKYPQGCVYDLQGWGEVAAPNVFICFQLKDGFENSFFRQCFEKNAHGIQLRKHITSGARSNGLLNISKKDFYDIRIPTPEHAEQQKIADCLSSLDEMITLEAKKLEALKTHKKGLMQQLFPRAGETVPRLRFPEFREAGEWEEKTISEIGELLGGLSAKSAEDFGQGSPFVTYRQIFNSTYIDMKECRRVRVEKNETQNKLQQGDILFTASSETPDEVGVASVILAEPEVETYLNSFCFALRAYNYNSLNGQFSRYLFHSPSYRKSVTDIAQGSTRFNISKSTFRQIRIAITKDKKEQQKIADSLSSLDDLITLETKKLEALKTHKKGLMQQLFPVLEDEE
ncbi:restriction endonuclease subunit S [Leptospirillum ferrooxidans]|uniref:Putative type I restriction enzyme, S subunit n=1 Tax=Leptospirillum ferrooxidans (strain C2-3) TaxID=1162668 RepID=I0IM39_LEPFC|nr:restriction endonuclease subunit S [Leptospirillum ferrooxidans]BAM06338.1 putative type I restriction enzyme, S subunit [Leptospirillum ferrooxidans C2-3]